MKDGADLMNSPNALRHDSADGHVAGGARYADDAPEPANMTA